MSKAREFWVAIGKCEGEWAHESPFYQTCIEKDPRKTYDVDLDNWYQVDRYNNLINVIEKSAYNKAVEALQYCVSDVLPTEHDMEIKIWETLKELGELDE
jgi:hypothetical protein